MLLVEEHLNLTQGHCNLNTPRIGSIATNRFWCLYDVNTIAFNHSLRLGNKSINSAVWNTMRLHIIRDTTVQRETPLWGLPFWRHCLIYSVPQCPHTTRLTCAHHVTTVNVNRTALAPLRYPLSAQAHDPFPTHHFRSTASGPQMSSAVTKGCRIRAPQTTTHILYV